MVGAAQVWQIDQRLRQGRQHLQIGAEDEPFGELACVVLSEDDGQLPPVFTMPLWARGQGAQGSEAALGALLYKTMFVDTV